MRDLDWCEDCGERHTSPLCPLCRSLRTALEQKDWPEEATRDFPINPDGHKSYRVTLFTRDHQGVVTYDDGPPTGPILRKRAK